MKTALFAAAPVNGQRNNNVRINFLQIVAEGPGALGRYHYAVAPGIYLQAAIDRESRRA